MHQPVRLDALWKRKRGATVKGQKFGLGDLVRSEADQYGELWPTVARENCTLVEQSYGQKLQVRLWRSR